MADNYDKAFDLAAEPEAAAPAAASATALDHALALAARGFRVFPLPAGRKAPPPKGWQRLASNDPGTIKSLFAGKIGANIGIATGQGLLVLDADLKSGGGQGLRKLELQRCEIPGTFTVKTPNGKHFYFASDVDLSNTVGKIAPGLDIRSAGGYVVAPSSMVGGKTYDIADDVPPAPAPEKLVRLAGEARGPRAERTSDELVVPLSTDLVRARCVAFLERLAPATQGGRNNSLMQVTRNLRDIGADLPECLDILREHWRCEPPLDVNEFEQTVRSSYRGAENQRGSAAPEVAFSIVAPEDTLAEYGPTITRNAADQPAEAKPSRFKRLACNEILPTFNEPWLIDGVLPLNALTMLTAKWGEAKTFNAIDVGMAVAHRGQWFGRRTAQGGVLYVSAEGSLGNRVSAYLTYNKLDPSTLPFHAIEETADIYGKADIAPLITEAKAIPELRLIILDTLAAMTPGADENSGRDMTQVMAHARQIQRGTGATVLLIHHEGKSENRGARGHSSLVGALDTELTIKNGTIGVRKQRDGSKDFKARFSLHEVEIGRDPHGRIVTSCVVVPRIPADAEEAFSKQPVKPGRAADALRVLEDLTLSGGKCPVATWKEEFMRRHYPGSRKSGSNAFYLAMGKLENTNHIRVDGDDVVRQ